MSKKQIQIIKQYIDEMLKENFIRFNKFDYAIFVLIIKKFENDLRMCINYKIFNALIIKNRNVSFLIRKTLTKLCAIKIYNKFDIIVVFNEIKIKKKQKKNRFFNSLRFFRIRNHVFRILQCIRNVLIIY